MDLQSGKKNFQKNLLREISLISDGLFGLILEQEEAAYDVNEDRIKLALW